MEKQEIERLAAALKPSGTIERGDTKSIEQRGTGVSLKTIVQGADIVSQAVELPGISLTYDVAADNMAILINGTPANPEERISALNDVAHFLRHITNRNPLTQNLLGQVEKQLAAITIDDQERTVMGASLNISAISGDADTNHDADATIVSHAPKFDILERTTVEPINFTASDLASKRHLPLPMWVLVALSILFITTAVVVLITL